MFKLLFRLIGLGVILLALYIILGPTVIKGLQSNLVSQVKTSAAAVNQLKTPIAAVSTPMQAAVNPTVVGATPAPATTTNTSNNNGSSALNYNNTTNTAFRRLLSQFPNTGVAPPKSNSYDNYTFPRKY
ncbi:MAG TPA: hypothetical protein VFQ30_06210 [Ktedonobacteraceae bacterium]|nr:hypothetical protein [Ktedonobacteraceae bacterium]